MIRNKNDIPTGCFIVVVVLCFILGLRLCFTNISGKTRGKKEGNVSKIFIIKEINIPKWIQYNIQ